MYYGERAGALAGNVRNLGLSEPPYEFDNETYDGAWHETRVTSMKFIPPGVSASLENLLRLGDVLDDPEVEGADSVKDEDSAGAASSVAEVRSLIGWRSNLAPVAAPETFQREVLSGFKARVETLLANDSEPDGDWFGFGGVKGAFPEGATVTVEGGWVFYQPPPGGGHLPGGFDYTIRDQFGVLSTARVMVLPQGTTSPGLNLVGIQPRVGGGVIAEFQGVPQQNYEIFATSSLLGPWISLGRVRADAAGRVRVEDRVAGDGRFYRTQLQLF